MKDRALIDADGYTRVHRLTPLLRFWSLILALLAIFVLNINASMIEDVVSYLQGGHLGEVGRGTLLAIGGFVLVCAVIWLVSGVWWRKLGYKLTDDEVALRHGVISTSFRSARYERIQAVDVVESIIARLLGLATVRVETAGGNASVIKIEYLPKAKAEELRAELLRRTNGGQVEQPEQAVEEAAEPALIPEIPILRTIAAEALRLPTLITGLIIGGLLFIPGMWTALLPIIVGFVGRVWSLVDSSWTFTALHDAPSHALNISYGLADRRRQTIRISRIHGVRVSQPFLWRRLGWYEVHVSVAGYGTKGGGKQSGSTRILPVGTREQALDLLALISDLDRAQIEDYARPEGHTQPTYTSPRRAWWVSPIDRKQQSVTLVDSPEPVTIVHRGRINRRVMVIGTPHIQELTLKVGPLSHLVGVRTVRFDLVAGPVRMAGQDLTPADASELLTRLRTRRLPVLEGPLNGPLGGEA
ncbi:PH domain-containing protein [Corynebacterium minutissimum]|uniref:Membrane protein n=1 Tax=Corynebacterium minutissimum TaxID=38301 RepID=A0A2X4RBF9_9CORY|nr:PH domain-containing protein [Corynebacterium minutissimum]KHO29947.1 membrane protein [Corynebacterium minutissimum]QPS60423.1 PH domain-containing protein [Corynebacterium minutissimum]QQA78788.1 PH domain-containing protein [Corynebacterium minutissimum]SQI00727.1 membrane protein [Corynebacterium minutissimum]VEG05205.1 membrane protein [Corynebacterium minutissimum]